MTFAEELSCSEIRARPAFYNEYKEYRAAAACLGGLHHHIGDSGSGSIGFRSVPWRMISVGFTTVRFHRRCGSYGSGY